MPATTLCMAAAPLAGRGAPLASAISTRMSAAHANRAARNVNGSASAIAYFATIKPLDHRSAKVSGVARMKKPVSCADGMNPLPHHHVAIARTAPARAEHAPRRFAQPFQPCDGIGHSNKLAQADRTRLNWEARDSEFHAA